MVIHTKKSKIPELLSRLKKPVSLVDSEGKVIASFQVTEVRPTADLHGEDADVEIVRMIMAKTV